MECDDDEFNEADEVNAWTEDDETRLDCDGTLATEGDDVEGNCEMESLEEYDDLDTFEMECDDDDINKADEVNV